MLSPAQYQSKLQSVSAVARKVLEAVPISDAWNRTQIRNELHRMTTSTVDGRTVDGCIAALLEAGLVREPSRDHFTQVRPHEKPAKPAAKCDGNHGGPRCADPGCWNDDPPTGTAILAHKPAFTLAEPVAKATKREDLLLRLEVLSDRLIETAAELDSIRKQVRAELESADAKVVKLDQLTELLDSLRP